MLDPIPEPKWIPLSGIDGVGNMGEILVSFWLHEKKSIDQPLTSPLDIHPLLRLVFVMLVSVMKKCKE